MKWVTSDHHFGHKKIIEYEQRPFDDVEEMDNTMIDRWNEVVGEDDTVYYLGDFGLTRSGRIKVLYGRLKGHKILVMGNHDWTKRRLLEKLFDEVHEKHLIIEERNLIMTHRPTMEMITINVSVDNWDFYPIPLPTPKYMLQLAGHSHRGYVVKDFTEEAFKNGWKRE